MMTLKDIMLRKSADPEEYIYIKFKTEVGGGACGREIRTVASFRLRAITEWCFHLDGPGLASRLLSRRPSVPEEVEKTCILLDLRGLGSPDCLD